MGSFLTEKFSESNDGLTLLFWRSKLQNQEKSSFCGFMEEESDSSILTRSFIGLGLRTLMPV